MHDDRFTPELNSILDAMGVHKELVYVEDTPDTARLRIGTKVFRITVELFSDDADQAEGEADLEARILAWMEDYPADYVEESAVQFQFRNVDSTRLATAVAILHSTNRIRWVAFRGWAARGRP